MKRHPTSKIQVYLVEEHTLFRDALRELLNREPDIKVVGETGEGEEAVRQLKTMDVDVVLLDVRLPGIDGIEVTRQLKILRDNLAVIILTEFQDGFALDAINAGALGYILKSSDYQQLVEAIQCVHQGQAFIDSTLTRTLFQEVSENWISSNRVLLNSRQLHILKHIANGDRYSDIASKLLISMSTVKREIRRIRNILDAQGISHAVANAYRRRII